MYQFKFADIGEGVEEGVLLNWEVKIGDTIKDGDTLFLVETDKVNAEIPSPVDGTITELRANEGDTIHVGDVVVVIDDGSGDNAEAPETHTEAVAEEETAGVVGEIEVSSEVIPSYHKHEQASEVNTKVLATPVARKLASDLGVDLMTVKGSGKNGRIYKEDIEKVANQTRAAIETPVKEQRAPSTPSVASGAEDRREKIDQTRKAIAKAMTLSKQNIPHSVLMNEIDVTELVAFRNENKAKYDDVKLTYLPFIIKAVVKAIKKYPVFNASFDPSSDEIIYKGQINIGIAVDTPYGLTVPVIKNADRLSIFELALYIKDLAERAAEKKLTMDDLAGSTFTITNYGAVGASFGTPVINYPESAILGIGKIDKKPVVIEDEIVIRSLLPISLGIDHRIIDGGDAGRFSGELKRLLSDPMLLLMV